MQSAPKHVILNGQTFSHLTHRLVLCGSFNPLHEGHLGMMSAASKHYPHLKPVFEITLLNADKGLVSDHDTEKRL